MLVCPAEGCNFKAKGDRALTTHVGKCKIAKLGLASVGKEVKRREDDYQQAKRRKISCSEHLEIVPEAVEPADVDLEVATAAYADCQRDIRIQIWGSRTFRASRHRSDKWKRKRR
ncbi:hypothetical protein BJ322DRAFT_1025230 [Thelephora terrestris]|uniref:Uncharacterized protein n=1 Tax=Thelephora terrestris TaxID=56493 RepID=A0A9P6L181_9AGAM|nr:hypothetical protein BJ322DRAFT_1025230 [Thelephora terrestris]